MSLPKLSHLQTTILAELMHGSSSSSEMTEKLASKYKHKSSLMAIHQTMMRMEAEKVIETETEAENALDVPYSISITGIAACNRVITYYQELSKNRPQPLTQ